LKFLLLLEQEVGASSRRAQENEAAAQDILLTLEENMSEIRDADLASLLTQLEFLDDK
jgi:flagellin-like hook-associated protein FlgL